MKISVGVVFILAFSSFTVANNDLLERTYKGLNKVLDFMYENRQDIILDGLFGIVLTKANLRKLLTHHDLLQEDRKEVSDLIRKATIVIKLIKPILPNLDKKYSLFIPVFINSTLWKAEDFGKNLLEIPYKSKVNQKYNITKDNLNVHTLGKVSPELSDYCINDLIKESLKNNTFGCHILKICKDLMMSDKDIRSGYEVTHQLLYIMTGKHVGCIKNSDWYAHKSKKLCSYIFWEAMQNLKFNFIHGVEDLLLEQITLCGMDGYEEFLTTPFIHYVLNLQKAEGCFGIDTSNMTYVEDADHIRRKRNLSFMKFNCNDHTTGLGASTLSLILRKLLKDNFRK